VDALYRPYSFAITGISPVAPTVSANQWLFPFLLQYRFKTPLVKRLLKLAFPSITFQYFGGGSDYSCGQPGSFLHSSHAMLCGPGVDVKILLSGLAGSCVIAMRVRRILRNSRIESG